MSGTGGSCVQLAFEGRLLSLDRQKSDFETAVGRRVGPRIGHLAT